MDAQIDLNLRCAYMQTGRVKSGIFGHQVNSDTHLQTVKMQMRRLPMSRLIRIFTVCLVYLIFIPIIQNKRNKVTVRIWTLSEFTRIYPTLRLTLLPRISDGSRVYTLRLIAINGILLLEGYDLCEPVVHF